MKFRNRPNVALWVESSRSYARALLRGIALFARNHTDWSLMHQEMSSDSEPPDWLEAASISGILARIESQETIRRLARLKVPTVDLRCRHKIDEIPQVETDDRQVAKLAPRSMFVYRSCFGSGILPSVALPLNCRLDARSLRIE